jgi:biopolymer transport protein ExbB
MHFIQEVFKFIAAGGIWVIPILVIGALGMGIVAERFFVLNRHIKRNAKSWDAIQELLHKGEFEKARDLTRDDKSTLGEIINVGLENEGVMRRREDIELAMEEISMSIMYQFHKRIAYLGLFANLATLLGLLGTILGLIEAFATVATAAPSEKSALLSLAISEAMSCTAMGLTVAMPMLTFSLLLNNKAKTIVSGLEIAALKTVNMIARTHAAARNQPQA